MSRDTDTHRWPDAGGDREAQRRELLDPKTQIVADRDTYLGQNRFDIGRRVADNQVELFVSGEAAPALQREFELHQPSFIAVHDVCASASLRLLSSLAGASGAPVQRLTMRRQGLGQALVVLQFVEVPLADGTTVRLYSTETNADTPVRRAIAHTLLANAHLGVLITGESPAPTIETHLQTVREAIVRGPWSSRELLIVPLGSPATLASQAQQLAGGTSLAVHVTPRATLPRHIWTFIAGTWNRLYGGGGRMRAIETELDRALPKPAVPWSEATTTPMPLGAEPRTPAPPTFQRPSAPLRAMPSPGATPWQPYVDRCATAKGVVTCCVFDMHSAAVLASSGSAPSPDRLAQHGASLLAAAANATRALGLGPATPETTISTPGHHLMLRPVPGHPGVALHAVIAAGAGNLTVARMQFDRIEPPA